MSLRASALASARDVADRLAELRDELQTIEADQADNENDEYQQEAVHATSVLTGKR